MGGTIIKDAPTDEFEVTGAIAAEGETGIGKTLRELGLSNSSDTKVQTPRALEQLLQGCDVCISFTSAPAELANLPVVVAAGRPLVLGTTGFNDEQERWIETSVNDKIPAVKTSNFSIGANALFALTSSLKNLPKNFDISILEMHHSGKVDAPSGTAKALANIIAPSRSYSKTVSGRQGISKRSLDELEVVSLRGGGIPGEHAVFAFGPYETLKLEHTVFSRSTFAQGALLAARWITSEPREARIYNMLEVLGFNS